MLRDKALIFMMQEESMVQVFVFTFEENNIMEEMIEKMRKIAWNQGRPIEEHVEKVHEPWSTMEEKYH